jgi:hypothetical protein
MRIEHVLVADRAVAVGGAFNALVLVQARNGDASHAFLVIISGTFPGVEGIPILLTLQWKKSLPSPWPTLHSPQSGQ